MVVASRRRGGHGRDGRRFAATRRSRSSLRDDDIDIFIELPAGPSSTGDGLGAEGAGAGAVAAAPPLLLPLTERLLARFARCLARAPCRPIETAQNLDAAQAPVEGTGITRTAIERFCQL